MTICAACAAGNHRLCWEDRCVCPRCSKRGGVSTLNVLVAFLLLSLFYGAVAITLFKFGGCR